MKKLRKLARKNLIKIKETTMLVDSGNIWVGCLCIVQEIKDSCSLLFIVFYLAILIFLASLTYAWWGGFLKRRRRRFNTRRHTVLSRREIFSFNVILVGCELCFSFDFSLYSQPEFRLKKTKPQASIEQFEVIALFWCVSKLSFEKEKVN